MEAVASRRGRSSQQPAFMGRSQSLRDVMVASPSSSAESVDGDNCSIGSNCSIRRGGTSKTHDSNGPSFSAGLALIIQEREWRQQQQQLGSVSGGSCGGSVNISSSSSSSHRFRSASSQSVFSKDEMSQPDHPWLFEDCEDTESTTSQGSSHVLLTTPTNHHHHDTATAASSTVAGSTQHAKIATASTYNAKSTDISTTVPSWTAVKSHSNRSLVRRRRVHHHVGFGKVDIRTYNVTVGDHPSCSSGPPLWYVIV
jgi:hypothetical protein